MGGELDLVRVPSKHPIRVRRLPAAMYVKTTCEREQLRGHAASIRAQDRGLGVWTRFGSRQIAENMLGPTWVRSSAAEATESESKEGVARQADDASRSSFFL